MCCIFTWMAWCFDASHRLVVFIMACLISSSVCCMLLTASLAGVAMGYNYSLAEYIDLKETNISVYIKRGVYDDEISDDFDWRRSGGGEPSISLKDQTGLRTGGIQEGQQPLAAGRRRSDNSIFESDEQNKYEGGLMRLTSTPAGESLRRFQPPEPPYTTSPSTTPNLVDGLLAVADSLPGGSKERLRAIQAAARHHEARQIELATAKVPDDPSGRIQAIEANAQIHSARRTDKTTTTDKYAKYFSQLAQHPGFPGSGLSARKFMESHDKDIMETDPPNRFRDAVFRGQLSGWPISDAPKSTTENFFDYEMSYKPTMPTPPTVQPLLVRPIEGKMPKMMWDMKPKPETPIRRTHSEIKSNELKDIIPKQGKMYSDYDDSHGLPIRKKRTHDGKVSVKTEPGALSSLITKITAYQNNLYSTVFDAEIPMNTNGKLLSDVQQSSKIYPKTDPTLPSELEIYKNNSSNTSKAMFSASGDNNINVTVKLFKVNSLNNLTSAEKMATENVDWKTRKRKKTSKGHEYVNCENKQLKSIWWRISDGILEQWSRIVFYIHKRNHLKLDHTQNSITPHTRVVSDSSDNNRSTFRNKLVATSTKRTFEGNQFNTTESKRETNLNI